jgi:hypothetical protein
MKMLYMFKDTCEIVEWQRVSSDSSGIVIVKSLLSGLMWYTPVERLVQLTPLMEALC